MLALRSTPLALAACLLQFAPTYTAGAVLAEPVAPLQDPWYSAPPGFEHEKPGAVLRVRQAPGNLTSLVTNCSAAYNVLYRTTNSRYLPDWAVTTVFLPAVAAPTALLSYQIPYDSIFLDASPSYAVYTADGAGTVADVSDLLANGWAVNLPDYEGPLASFTAGVVSGHSTIDSIRAAFRANRTLGWDIAADARYAMWGYSGGALASEWAAELQVQYAPEMQFSGAALGGLTPNVTSVLYAINGGITVGLAPASILGLSSQFPDERAFFISRLKTDGPYNRTGFLATQNYTLTQALIAYVGQDIGKYFIGGIADVSTSPQALAVINRDGIMGYHGVPQMPIFAYKAVADEVSAVEDTDALVAKYCNIGANILYNRNPVGGHTAEATNGRPAALAWLGSVLSGTYAQDYSATGCTIQTVVSNITDSPFRKRTVGWRPEEWSEGS